MALVFQYGSNMSSARLNSVDRLNGDAQPIGVVFTTENHELVFNVWSVKNKCAASSIIPGRGRRVWGVLYEIPDWLIRRDTARPRNRRSMDAVEGEGSNYERGEISVCYSDGQTVAGPVLTYIGRDPQDDIQTNAEYAGHILAGLREHGDVPGEYVEYAKARIVDNNPSLAEVVKRY